MHHVLARLFMCRWPSAELQVQGKAQPRKAGKKSAPAPEKHKPVVSAASPASAPAAEPTRDDHGDFKPPRVWQMTQEDADAVAAHAGMPSDNPRSHHEQRHGLCKSASMGGLVQVKRGALFAVQGPAAASGSRKARCRDPLDDVRPVQSTGDTRLPLLRVGRSTTVCFVCVSLQ